MESVLLLNASYQPMKVISWKRAITLAFMGKVEVVEEYDHHIRSVSLVFRAPAVVRLVRYVSFSKKTPPLNRANLLARDDFQCQYCSIELTPKTATLDHVVPRSQGGPGSWDNLVVSCGPCNRRKGGRTPREAGMPLKSKPIQPTWLPVLQFRLNGNVPDSWHTFIDGWTRTK